MTFRGSGAPSPDRLCAPSRGTSAARLCARGLGGSAGGAGAYPRLTAAARAIASRSSSLGTAASDRFTSAGSAAGSGALRVSVRHDGLASGSTEPTWNRSDLTSSPRARSFVTIASASSDSSCVHPAVAARTWSTPRSSFVGRARRAIFVPTASSQSRGATGGASTGTGARASAERSSTAPRFSGIPRRMRRPISRRVAAAVHAVADLGLFA